MEFDSNPRIVSVCEKIFMGMSLRMSLTNNRTGELWRTFMPRRKEIPRVLSADLFSLQSYPHGYWEEFNPDCEFEKWALMEVPGFDETPDGMELFVLPRGEYAVFAYKGAAGDSRVFEYIFKEWLPASGYRLDNRPHFEVLGERYNNTSPDSEEEIWIPVILGDHNL